MFVMHTNELTALKEKIREWGMALGFDAIGFAGVDLPAAENNLAAWLAAGAHGTMNYMAAHGNKRTRPSELVEGTRSVITARMNYGDSAIMPNTDADKAQIARYALGRDYHSLLRGRLQKLATRIEAAVPTFSYRVFTDSAPVMEVDLAVQSGIGWRGKNTLLLDRNAGSWFFIGEIYCSEAFVPDALVTDHCGTCTACLDACPTQAFDSAYKLDARRCVSYLTIENKEEIPLEFRAAMGNRMYGCDDCQSVCPWNRFAPDTREADFAVRNALDNCFLAELFGWSEVEFESRLAGSAIRRIGYVRWLRNIAVALGNVPADSEASVAAIAALKSRADFPSELVREHVAWALARHGVDGLPVAIGRDESLHHSLHDPG
ncbi:MAG: tRNA epoxyqueuosine(34) reductase QueG [Rhodocyclaceae bacterium]|nr:tRNA epoxyqueuosine(34) reductase QueG [Rhodocyclaceae bacterium]